MGKHTYNEAIPFTLRENIIRCEDSVKLLGVSIYFDKLISNVCNKASRQLNISKRIGVIYVN